MSKINVEKFPREILEKAVMLRQPLKEVYIALYSCGHPATAEEIAQILGHARSYIHSLLLQLVDLGLVKRSKRSPVRAVIFEVIQ